MSRPALLLAVGVVMAACMPAARGQDSDEVKRLKERVELLEAKLKLAEREVQDLKKENEQLKTGGAKGAAKPADDGFGVGTKLAGTLTRSWADKGKRVTMGNSAELDVTKRSGKSFTAELWLDGRKFGMEVEGTIDGVSVTFKSTKSLGNAKEDVVGLHTFKGSLDRGGLSGKTTKKGDQSYLGEWKLKAQKE